MTERRPMREWDLDAGVRLRICEWGPAEGRPVVVLHGYLEQGAAWQGVADHLDRRLVAPDHRGHGLSAHIAPGGFYHFFDYVADLDALVEHLGGPVDLVGHSMGGTIACYYAGARPECVRRLVLVEGMGPPDASAEALNRGRRHLADRRAGKQHQPLADLDEAVARMRRWNGSISVEDTERLARRITRPRDDGTLQWTWDPRHKMRNAVPFEAARFYPYLRAIEAPTLAVKGGTSWFGIPDEAERAACIDDVRIVTLDGAGHLIHHDAPNALAALIRDHLDG